MKYEKCQYFVELNWIELDANQIREISLETTVVSKFNIYLRLPGK